jgi:hypothetical protein
MSPGRVNLDRRPPRRLHGAGFQTVADDLPDGNGTLAALVTGSQFAADIL